jgi:hypothetical protein
MIPGPIKSGVVLGPEGRLDDTHVNRHLVGEILVVCDEGVPILVLETDALGDTRA